MTNVNDVYRTVQAILNKEQRGYLAPLVFNEFAEQAQLEIFESYFYNKSFFLTSKKGVDGIQVMNIDEKLDLFMVYDSNELTFVGDAINSRNSRFLLPTDLYRLCDVYYSDTNGTRIVDKINHKGSQYVRNSSKTQPSVTFPKYLRFGETLELNPNMPQNSEVFTIDQAFLDEGANTFALVDRNNITKLCSVVSFRTQPVIAAQELEPITLEGTGTYVDGVYIVSFDSLPRPFEIGDEVTIQYIYDADITIDYFKKPAKPNWNYIGTTTPIYNPTGSIDFELHPSDQYVLVLKILELAGAEVKDVAVVQYAAQELQVDNVNKKS